LYQGVTIEVKTTEKYLFVLALYNFDIFESVTGSLFPVLNLSSLSSKMVNKQTNKKQQHYKTS